MVTNPPCRGKAKQWIARKLPIIKVKIIHIWLTYNLYRLPLQKTNSLVRTPRYAQLAYLPLE